MHCHMKCTLSAEVCTARESETDKHRMRVSVPKQDTSPCTLFLFFLYSFSLSSHTITAMLHSVNIIISFLTQREHDRILRSPIPPRPLL